MNKKERITSIVLALVLFLLTTNSTYYFLGELKVTAVEWLLFNGCAPSSLSYLVGLVFFFITRNRLWLLIAVVPIFFFGTMGLFIFPWSGMNIIAQVSHIVMTLSIVWAISLVLRTSDYKALGAGLFASILIFIPFITVQQYYCRVHADDLMRILQIN